VLRERVWTLHYVHISANLDSRNEL
jgi:hypothetical protein